MRPLRPEGAGNAAKISFQVAAHPLRLVSRGASGSWSAAHRPPGDRPSHGVAITADPKDFSIQALSTQDQLVRSGAVARWDFDVTPLRGGLRRLRLLASMRMKIEGKDEVVDLPSYESGIQVAVAPMRAVGHFCATNWQWMPGTIAIPLIVWAAIGTGASKVVLEHVGHWLRVSQ
jgi:hypothetical protein